MSSEEPPVDNLANRVELYREAFSHSDPRRCECRWNVLHDLQLRDLGSDGYCDLAKALADDLITDYHLSESVDTLKEAISVHEKALLHWSPGRVGRAELLEELSSALYTLCRQHSAEDLHAHRCIELLREVLEMRPPEHPMRGHSMLGLAKGLFFVGQDYHLHGQNVVDEVIFLARETLRLWPVDHCDRADALNMLGSALRRTFEHSGDPDVLAECIHTYREALLLRPPEHPRRDRSLNNLSLALLGSFEFQGGFEVLAESIDLSRETLGLRPVGHPLRQNSLINLGISLSVSVAHHGQTELLSEAIRYQREALHAGSTNPVARGGAFRHLANSLVASFRHNGRITTLVEAISLYRSAMELHPSGHHDRDELLATFAEALELSFDAHGNASTLSEAMALHGETLQIRPRGHPQRVETLENLARLHLKTEPRSWLNARALYDQALEICPTGYPSRARLLSGISRCFLDRDSECFDPATGICHLASGYADQLSHINQRLRSAVSDLRRIEDAWDHASGAVDTRGLQQHREEVLQLYIQVIGLLPRAANFGLDSDARLRAVSGSDEISRNAAGRAFKLGRIAHAVEMLEQGRCVFWSQSLHLRSTGFDNLPDEDRQELQRLLRLLEQGARRLESAEQTKAQRERDLEHRRRLNEQAEALISKIRGYPGLDRFLLPPAFDALFGALPQGYVVIVNGSRVGHHALLLRRDTNLAVSLDLTLPRITIDSTALQAQLPRDVGQEIEQNVGSDGLRAMRIVHHQNNQVGDLLAVLWTSVVQPVIRELGLRKQTGRDRPRLWWCVTGELGFLPIHAAGDYQCASPTSTAEYVVSSYIPTLSSLTKAQRGWEPVSRRELAGLLISSTSADDGPARYLPNATQEVCVVHECFESAQAQVLNTPSEHVTLAQLRALLDGTPAHILHLACHAVQESDPLRSALILQDGRLTIEDVMQLNLTRAVLAFLSACQTAKGDRNAPDQAVHLAASMLFCGFRSVIGTMWLMHDADGPIVAQGMYDALFKNEHLDLDDIPYALDEAVQALRRSGVSAERWALFMHIGG